MREIRSIQVIYNPVPDPLQKSDFLTSRYRNPTDPTVSTVSVPALQKFRFLTILDRVDFTLQKFQFLCSRYRNHARATVTTILYDTLQKPKTPKFVKERGEKARSYAVFRGYFRPFTETRHRNRSFCKNFFEPFRRYRNFSFCHGATEIPRGQRSPRFLSRRYRNSNFLRNLTTSI